MFKNFSRDPININININENKTKYKCILYIYKREFGR